MQIKGIFGLKNSTSLHVIIYSLARIADLLSGVADFKCFIKEYGFVSTMPIFLDNLAWKSTFIKFTIRQWIRLSVPWFY